VSFSKLKLGADEAEPLSPRLLQRAVPTQPAAILTPARPPARPPSRPPARRSHPNDGHPHDRYYRNPTAFARAAIQLKGFSRCLTWVYKGRPLIALMHVNGWDEVSCRGHRSLSKLRQKAESDILKVGTGTTGTSSPCMQ
jgi:hypothetical protein